ncbi:MAG: n-acetylglutamate synthase [Gelidibacter sp.]
MDYNNKRFRTILNSSNGETSPETIFEYKQNGNILTSEYQGGQIVQGHLIGLVDEEGNIEMHYHQVNKKGELVTGICSSKPEIIKDGKIRLHENWKWTSGDQSNGTSILEEL